MRSAVLLLSTWTFTCFVRPHETLYILLFCTQLICISPALKWLIGTSCCPPLLLLAVDFTHSKLSTGVEKEISLRFWLSFQQFYSSFWVFELYLTDTTHLFFKHRKNICFVVAYKDILSAQQDISSTKNEDKLLCREIILTQNILICATDVLNAGSSAICLQFHW